MAPTDRARRVLVAGWIGSENLGDELIFSALTAKLRARGAEVGAISVDPSATARTHGVRAVSAHRPASLWGALDWADAVVFGGGGLLQDETSPFNLPYHLGRVGLARLRRRPVAAVGVGAGRLTTTAGRRLVAAGLSGAVAVTARDEASATLLREVGVSDVTTTADLAFSLPDPPQRAPDRIVACLRPWSAERGRLPVSLRGRADDTPASVVAAFASGLDATAAALGVPVRFVALSATRDDVLHRRVAAAMDAPVEFAAPALDELLEEVGRGVVVVAVRFHAAVAAVLNGRPVVLIGYAPKVDALVDDLGGGTRLLPWASFTGDDLCGAASAVAGSADAVRQARTRLRDRESGNDAALDRLLAVG